MTFASLSQPREFLACFFAGCLSGLVYTPLNLIKNSTDKAWAKIIVDIIFFTLAGAVLAAVCVIYKLGNFRVFMGVSCLLGIVAYAKSLHKAVAFADRLLYNKTVNICLKIKKAASSLFKKVEKYVGRKKTKGIRGGFKRSNNADCDIRGDNRISNVRYIRAEGKDRKTRRGNSRPRTGN